MANVFSESLHASYSSYAISVLRFSRNPQGMPYETGNLYLGIFSDAVNSNTYGIFLKNVKKVKNLLFKKIRDKLRINAYTTRSSEIKWQNRFETRHYGAFFLTINIKITLASKHK